MKYCNKKTLYIALFLIFTIFCYFRIKPIYLQTVPYTFDQGRDFLKAEEIIRDKHLLFIGPTTGLPGLFHGVWWYYLLAVFYVVFNGLPQGFYIGLFFVSAISTCLFFLFLKKEINTLLALLFLSMVSVSPYFIRTSFFVANNYAIPPFILLLLFGVYMFFKKSKRKYLCIIGFALGFIAEFEFSFGFLMIPSFLILAVFFQDFRKHARQIKSAVVFFMSLIIPFMPRILFELKNHFIQSKSVILFLHNPTATNQQSLEGAIRERGLVFLRYYQDVFFIHGVELIFFLLFIYFLFFGLKKLHDHKTKTIVFFTLLTIFIFITSLSNKNNFFWSNYLEGIQYIFLFLAILVLDALRKKRYFFYGILSMTLVFFALNIYLFTSDIIFTTPSPDTGLKAQVERVRYLYKQSGNNNFCVRIYTPPVIPYTYTYLFHFFARVKKYKNPSTEYVNRRCWYIIEQEQDSDVFRARITKWKSENISAKARLLKIRFMDTGTRMEYWEE